MRGKEKCRALKEIRRQIARENDIPYAVSQCTYQGECRGTCPKCEAELRYLERELAIRKGLGKAVAVAGISASVCAGLTACSPMDRIQDIFHIQGSGSSPDIAGNITEAEPFPETPDLSVEGMMEELPEESQDAESGRFRGTDGNGESGSGDGEGESQGADGEGESRGGDGTGQPQVSEPELAGMLPPSEEDGGIGEILPGEIFPGEDQEETSAGELQGDIALQEEGADYGLNNGPSGEDAL